MRNLKKKKKKLYIVKQIKQQEIKALKRAAKYRREFLGNVSHELKTPIFNIQGYVHTLLDGAIYDDDVNKKYLHRTSKSIERLIAIIDDLDSLARLESDELRLEKTSWDILELIKEVFESFEVKSADRNIKLILPKQKRPIMVFADRNQMSQVLHNFISNGIKYGKDNGYVRGLLDNKEGRVKVTIQDNGIGIDEKNIPRLFERFYRVDKGRSREAGGTGLGLAIVKHILETHGEEVTVFSKQELGTKFSFSIRKP